MGKIGGFPGSEDASREYGRRRFLFNVAAALALAGLARPVLAEGTARLMVLGDSLAAGFGLPAAQAFPTRLEAALRARGHDIQVVNAGVSGDTSAGGLARLEWVLRQANPRFAIV